MGKPAGGKVIPLTFESRVLKRNPLQDPHVRTIPVYLPPGYWTQSQRRYPVIYVLTGFTGRGSMLLNVAPWGETLEERLNRLVGTGRLVESIVVMPDCFTAYGGSQYLNSTATGRYEDHLMEELIPFVDAHYRTIPQAGARAVMGKSSGGYGALVLGMKHPGVFGLVACHSGDMYFELCYKPDFIGYLREIGPFKNAAGFLRRFPALPQKAEKRLFPILNTIAMSACYSPRRGFPPFELPFQERTGELREKVWRRWLRHDPVYLAGRYARNLKKLRLLFLDCGTRDEFNLQYGARILVQRLKRLGVAHIYEEFPDGHMNISYRYDRSLSLISRSLRTT